MEHMLRERMALALEKMATALPTGADQFALAEEAKDLLARHHERRLDSTRQARSAAVDLPPLESLNPVCPRLIRTRLG